MPATYTMLIDGELVERLEAEARRLNMPIAWLIEGILADESAWTETARRARPAPARAG